MTKFPKRCVSKQTSAPVKAKVSKKMKIPTGKAKAPVKSRRTAKVTKCPETEDENPESMDSGFGESQPRVSHRYPTRARIAAQATQNNDRNQTTRSRAKPAKPKRYKNPSGVDKANDGSAANGAQPQQGTSSNERSLSGLPVSRPVSQNPATPEDLNSIQEPLSNCSSADWLEHIRWLQPRRDIGLWIECTREGCGKWRYAEDYHDPLDVPKIWFCEMNTDARFADCSIPQEETPEAESQWYIENAYNAGSIVWAKVNGFPWWPAMVDDCPDLLKYWDTRGSSIVPYKYHVKFFNEMTIAWMPVRKLKPYAENPRSTFLKKTVFRRKDYSQEVDAACEVANQALPLSLLERLKRFSWAAQISGGLREEGEGLAPVEVARKKKKSTNKSTIDSTILPGAAGNTVSSPVLSSTRKRPVDKKAKENVMRNTKSNVTEKVTGKQMLNVRSRIINVETDSAINTGPSTSQRTGVSKQFTFNVRCSDSGSQSPCRDKASFLEPNELFNENSIDRSEVDNSNVDDATVPSTASKSTPSTREEPKPTEEAYNPRCTKRVTRADIAALAQEIRNTRPFYAKKARNSRRAATQSANTSNPSLALHSRELSLPVRSDETFDRSSVDLRSSVDASADIGPTVPDREDRGEVSTNDIFAPGRSRTEVFAGTEEPVTSPWQPIEIDLTGSSTDFEGNNDRRESPEDPNRAETRDNSRPFNQTLASSSHGLSASFGSITSYGSFGSLAPSSQPEWDEMSDRCPSPCGLCALSVDLEDSDSNVDAADCIRPDVSAREDREGFLANDIFASCTSRPEVLHSRSASRESGVSSFRMNSASAGEGSSRSDGGSEINFSPGRSGTNFPAGGSETNFSHGRSKRNSYAGEDESTSSSREPILVDLTDSSTDFEEYYARREDPDYLNRAEIHADSQSFDPRLASSSNVFGPSNTTRRFSAFESLNIFGSTALPSQPEWNNTSERRSNISGWYASPVDFQDSGPSFSLLDILTRFCSSESGQSSSTVVSSSQPETDEAFERRPRFPGLCNRLRDLSTSTYSSTKDVDFCSPGHTFSNHLFEVVTINDRNIE